jgi:hypothetical protein
MANYDTKMGSMQADKKDCALWNVLLSLLKPCAG